MSGISIFIRIALFLAFVGATALCIWFVTTAQLTDRESALVGLVISALSVLAGWIITDLYSNSQHESMIQDVKEEYRSNLKTYALKASEKVSNLSSELTKLATYLEDELAYTEYRSPEEELLAKEERIESAIHIVRTLKTVNDTAMSDWEGVIGDELDERREAEEEKQEQLKAMIERIEESIEQQRAGTSAHEDLLTRSEALDLRRQLERALYSLNNTTVPKAIRKGHRKETVERPCPACGKSLSYQQRPLAHSIKAITCEYCSEKLMSTFRDTEGFHLETRRVEAVTINTPCCSRPERVELDTLPATSVTMSCGQCGGTVKIVRTRTGIEVKQVVSKLRINADENLSEAIVEKVAQALPVQPWPTGIHKTVAADLGITTTLAHAAIQELIKRGRFFVQHDGVLYSKIDPISAKKEGSI